MTPRRGRRRRRRHKRTSRPRDEPRPRRPRRRRRRPHGRASRSNTESADTDNWHPPRAESVPMYAARAPLTPGRGRKQETAQTDGGPRLITATGDSPYTLAINRQMEIRPLPPPGLAGLAGQRWAETGRRPAVNDEGVWPPIWRNLASEEGFNVHHEKGDKVMLATTATNVTRNKPATRRK